MRLLHCNYCKDVIKLTAKARTCTCGGSGGAITGVNLYSYHGDASLAEIEDEDLIGSDGHQFVGRINEAGAIFMGKRNSAHIIKPPFENRGITKETLRTLVGQPPGISRVLMPSNLNQQ